MIMKYIELFASLVMDVIHNRGLLWILTKKDLKNRYLGSYLGFLWAFIQPLVNVFIFWFVFQVGFKSLPVDNFPFLLWLVTGMFPWLFVSDSIASATNSIAESSYLVKKVVFRVSLLPIVKILSALIVHVFFIGLLFILFLLYGYSMSAYNFQVVYYLFAAICLALGISFFTATLMIFFKDMGQLVTMILQFGFWGTPIFWSYRIIPEKYLPFLKLNPGYYIVEGYRNCFIYHRWFWQEPHITIYFWVCTILLLLVGGIIFKKLRPHFADVL